MAFTYKLDGIQQTIAVLQNFDKKLRRSVLNKVGRAMAKPIKAGLIRNAPVQTKTWRKSIGSKIKVYNNAKGAAVFVVVGPLSAYFAMVTFDPKARKVSVQAFRIVKGKGNQERGKRTNQRTGDVGGRVSPMKGSKKGIADGTPALFWRGRDGKIHAMPLTHKRRPVMYSHLIEKGTKNSRGHHMIERTLKETRAASMAAGAAVMADEVAKVGT